MIRDRIRELRRVPARELRPHPRNWRTHPPQQRAVLDGVLAEIGYADALLARELPDGTLELIDGHLRAETTPDSDVPVLVVDLDDAEADKLLALLDPLAAMAQQDDATLNELVRSIDTENQALRQFLDGLTAADEEPPVASDPPASVPIPESFQVVVECRDEEQQQALFERLSAEGFACRVLML